MPPAKETWIKVGWGRSLAVGGAQMLFQLLLATLTESNNLGVTHSSGHRCSMQNPIERTSTAARVPQHGAIMKHSILAATALTTLSLSAIAQNHAVAPFDHTDAEGNSSQYRSALSYGVARWQILHDKSEVQIPNGKKITKVGFRQNGGTAMTTTHRLQMEILMSAASRTYDKMTSNFNTNYKGTPVTVYTRKIYDLPSYTATNDRPSKNYVLFPLDVPYVVDSNEDMIVEYRCYANTNSNNAFNYYIDATNYASKRTAFGTACPGSNSKSLAMTDNGAPYGATWSPQVTNAQASTVCALFVGLSNTKFQGAIPLPLPLDGVGATGCKLYVDPLLTIGRGANTAGTATFSMPIPDQPSLYGVTLYHQAMALDAFANNFGWTFSEGRSMTIGQRPKMRKLFQSSVTSSTGSLSGVTTAIEVSVFTWQ